MNAKKSLIIFILSAIALAGVVWAFAHGCQTVGSDLWTGLAWIGGSLGVAALGVFLSYKLKK
jgi:hypothetical protein